MLIGVISDTHIPECARKIPKAVLDEFRKVDMVLHAGDLVELRVLDELAQACPKVRAVCGNMDGEAARQALPVKDIIQAEGFKIALMHGYGHPDKLLEVMKKEFAPERPDVVIFGHSHRALSEESAGVIYFNPGSPTDTVFAPYRSYGLIRLQGPKIEPRIVRI